MYFVPNSLTDSVNYSPGRDIRVYSSPELISLLSWNTQMHYILSTLTYFLNHVALPRVRCSLRLWHSVRWKMTTKMS